MSKSLIVALTLLMVSCQTKDKRRYFFIGYHLKNDNVTHVGNFYSDGALMNVDSFINIIYRENKCYGFSRSQCIITGIYEFKDSIEYKAFKNGRNEPKIDCNQL